MCCFVMFGFAVVNDRVCYIKASIQLRLESSKRKRIRVGNSPAPKSIPRICFLGMIEDTELRLLRLARNISSEYLKQQHRPYFSRICYSA